MDLDESLRYPLGRFAAPERITREEREQAMGVLAELPSDLRNAVRGLDVAQLETPYREGGWTVQQLVHHLADSHTNALVRVKLALTETDPVIKPYDQAAWARLHDARSPIEWSLELLEALHARWVFLLQGLTEGEWARPYVHPEDGGRTSVELATLRYAWHSRHHAAHILRLRQREGW